MNYNNVHGDVDFMPNLWKLWHCNDYNYYSTFVQLCWIIDW